MPEKLLTLQELASYLGLQEEKVIDLVDRNVISAYKVGGEFLRFRKDQIDAIRSEIKARSGEPDKAGVSEARTRVKERQKVVTSRGQDSFKDRFADFIYFYDFYIISAFLIIVLLMIIFRG